MVVVRNYNCKITVNIIIRTKQNLDGVTINEDYGMVANFEAADNDVDRKVDKVNQVDVNGMVPVVFTYNLILDIVSTVYLKVQKSLLVN